MRSESLESIQDFHLKSKLGLQSSAGALIGNVHIGARAAGAAFINVGLPTNSSPGADAFGRLLHTSSGCGSAGGADTPWALGYGGCSAWHSSLLLLLVVTPFISTLRALPACGSRCSLESPECSQQLEEDSWHQGISHLLVT